MVKFMIVVAVLFGGAAALIWAAFLRPVPVETATAVIRNKTFKPAGTYWQQQVGAQRGFRTATPISVAESYVLELESAELGLVGFYSIQPAEEANYPVGGTVVMEYQQRGLPMVGRKTVILSARPH